MEPQYFMTTIAGHSVAECLECGTVVTDRPVHNRWHNEISALFESIRTAISVLDARTGPPA